MSKLLKDLNDLKTRLYLYEKILTNSCDEVYVTDGDGITIFANPVSENNYGIPVDQLIGKSVWELEQRGIYFPAVTPMVLEKKRSITIDQETATGKKLMITATPIFNDQGDIEMVICNSRDVTALEDMKNNYNEIKKKAFSSSFTKDVEESQDPGNPVYAAHSPMNKVMLTVEKIAKIDSTVLLLGKSGTGKDLLARHMHKLNYRRDKQFLKINCAALPRELLESELFGYRPGAFTGASSKGKTGLFTLANGGTIFLDEITELPPTLQPKLLQVIEEQEFTPIGSDKVEKVNVRIIAATNRDLSEMIRERRFREDLYYRLSVMTVRIPALKERTADIPVLIAHFLDFFNHKHHRRVKLSQDTIELMQRYHWPGNVRELKHLLEYLVVVIADDLILPEHIPPHIKEVAEPQKERRLPEILEAYENHIVTESFRKFGSSYKVAENLGISQSSAIRKIRKYINNFNQDSK